MLAVVLLSATTLAACEDDARPTMMGARTDEGRPSSAWSGGWMMGPAPDGYRLRDLDCQVPSPQPGTTVRVVLGDMGMARMMGGTAPLGGRMMLRAMPWRVPAGPVTFEVANMGWRTHELVVLPLPPGSSAGQRVVGPDGRVDETGSLGEASASCAEGSGEGIGPGEVGWVTLDLAPGTYELVCNLRNHYADGMHQELAVG